MIDISAYVLIGGRSSRLGRDKALVEIDGTSLAERSVRTLNEAFPDRGATLIAAQGDQFAGRFAAYRLITDTRIGRGPFGALNAALGDAATEWIIVLACDLPFVTADLLRHLARKAGPGVDAVVPMQPDGRLQPLAAIYRTPALLQPVKAVLESDVTPALASLVEGIQATVIPFSDIAGLPEAEHFFVNINTSDDLEKAVTITRQYSSKSY